MKLNDKNTQIALLEQRINMLTDRGETTNSGLIAKAKRQIRKLQSEDQVE